MKEGQGHKTAEEIKPEDILQKPKHVGLKNLVLICEAMEEYRTLSKVEQDLSEKDIAIKFALYMDSEAWKYDHTEECTHTMDEHWHYFKQLQPLTRRSSTVESKSEGVSVKDAEQFAIEFVGYMQGECWEYDYREEKTHSTAEHLEYFKQKYGPLTS